MVCLGIKECQGTLLKNNYFFKALQFFTPKADSQKYESKKSKQEYCKQQRVNFKSTSKTKHKNPSQPFSF